MTLVTVLSGLPASGKSTYARELYALRVNLDDIRAMMGWKSHVTWSKKQEDIAVETMLSAIEAAVENGHDVVVDNTHLTARIPGYIRRRVGGRATFKVVYFHCHVEECIRRDALRDRPVGEAVIRRMAKTASKWMLTDEYMNVWPKIEKYSDTPGLPNCLIVDLDGTTAIHNGRGPYDTEKCDTDLVDPAVILTVAAYAKYMESLGLEYRVFFKSGREGTESVQAKTQKWLQDIPELRGVYWQLVMRPEGDDRPDFVTKYELFNQYIRGKYNVSFVLDDRDQVVRLWRELGLKCYQVGYGNF